MIKLGSLKRIDDLRAVWPDAAEDFTPWLAEPENLQALSQTLDLELHMVQTVRANQPDQGSIECLDRGSGKTVLIIAQMDLAETSRLGQSLTWAAMSGAGMLIWVAPGFNEEQIKVLQWLNTIAGDQLQVFGIDIELWQIGDSPIATKLDVRLEPVDWRKGKQLQIPEVREQSADDIKKMQLEYWTQMRELMLKRNGVLKPHKPLAQHWSQFGIGETDFGLIAFADIQDRRIGCGLMLSGPDAKAHFQLLRRDRAAIEAEVGFYMEWRELPERKESLVYVDMHDQNPGDTQEWERQHMWLCEKLHALYRTFGYRIKRLKDPTTSEQELVEI